MDMKNLSTGRFGELKSSHDIISESITAKKANGNRDALFRFLQKNQAQKDAQRVDNTEIFDCLQTLLTHASWSRLTIDIGQTNISALYHILIYKTYILP